MSDRLPRITAAQLLRALHRAGWEIDHQRGAHVYLRLSDRDSSRSQCTPDEPSD